MGTKMGTVKLSEDAVEIMHFPRTTRANRTENGTVGSIRGIGNRILITHSIVPQPVSLELCSK
jgi:hypothetical protein